MLYLIEQESAQAVNILNLLLNETQEKLINMNFKITNSLTLEELTEISKQVSVTFLEVVLAYTAQYKSIDREFTLDFHIHISTNDGLELPNQTIKDVLSINPLQDETKI